jgi:hypothetical protein
MRLFHGTTTAAAEAILANGLAAGSLVTAHRATARDYGRRRAATARERRGVVVAVLATDADVERGDLGHIGFVAIYRTLRVLRAEAVEAVEAYHWSQLGEQDFREGGGVAFSDPGRQLRPR